ncbi:helix-turn-helix domain-containing protein [Chryseobacterium paridis]|uniref:AraC family transcriptional regulator n=1 Tax=Chryseobacterium paridis TaxID=2800328 RepID=A0ABS1G0L7_9FLAO|nr:helix-turn-helix domain-containing protein [Chryseobacterium paridis]MBK1898240.1 AraC family transcriptional regulator [Chryseobacterium paridis]
MNPFTFLPIHKALRTVVQSIVIIDVNLFESDLKTEYCYPWTATTSIFFTLNDNPLLLKQNDHYLSFPFCYVVGPRLINDVINFGNKRRTVGVTFKAGGFQRLTGIPVNLLTKENIDMHQIFGKETKEVEDKLKEAKSNSEILEIIENFLLKRTWFMKEFSLFDWSIERCVQDKGNIQVNRLASISGLSTRQFERRCKESLGISPKLFSKLTRFGYAYGLKEHKPELSWINIAYESGYYDQMHLIHDFKLFSGYNPSVINQIKLYDTKVMSILQGE